VKALPPMKDMYKGDTDPGPVNLEFFEASQALELHRWAEAAALPLVPGTKGDDSITYRARAIGAARSGDLAAAHKSLDQLAAMHADAVKRKLTYAEAIDYERREAEAWIDHAEGKNDAAIKLLRDIADSEHGVLEASEGIPAREMLGDMLLEMNQSGEALAEYEADLKQNPSRFDSLYGAAQAAEINGNRGQADRYYARLVKNCDGSSSARPELGRARAQLAKPGAETASASQN
jgi:predicted Zn-dependent protease